MIRAETLPQGGTKEKKESTATTTTTTTKNHSSLLQMSVDTDAAVSVTFRGEEQLVKAIESFGCVGGPPAPRWLPPSQVSCVSALLHWEAVTGASVYHVELRAMRVQEIDVNSDIVCAFAKVYAGSECECRCQGLSAGSGYEVRVAVWVAGAETC